MDFFEAQDRARRRSGRLVTLFALAVLGIVAGSYFATVAGIRLQQDRREPSRSFRVERDSSSRDSASGWTAGIDRTSWWQPDVLGWTAAVTLAVVGIASLVKWSQMRSGGSVIAAMAGGRAVNPETTDLRERQLLNVVEEMALASGLPVPAVFILEEEAGINAFAAGLTTSDAAVAVTRGTLEKLNRDELQGVIAHEFSHILNGDMRLNVRITAIVFGILVLGLIGRGLLRTAFYSGAGRRRRSGDGKGVAVMVGAGAALMLLGYLGYFFGRMIQAAVSRQREYLADASAVQFTRNPTGIAGALKKIGGYTIGSRIASDNAAQLGHFFFAQGFSSFGGLWATHPPLAERVRAIDPSFDGQFPKVPISVDVARESFASAGLAPAKPQPPARANFHAARVIATAGALEASHVSAARQLLQQLPPALRAAAEHRGDAPALVCALLLDPANTATRDRQLASVAANGAPFAARVGELAAHVPALPPGGRLPLLQLALPSLRGIEGEGLDRFLGLLDDLVHADAQVTLFEFALQKLIAHQLRLAAAPSKRPPTLGSLNAARDDLARVLSALAIVGHGDTAAAYAAGLATLRDMVVPPPFVEAADQDLVALDAAMERLSTALPAIKRRVITAAAHVVGHDEEITPEESELLRATAAALDCPLPIEAA